MHHCRNGSCLCTGLHLESVAADWGKWLLFSLHHSSKAISLVLCLVQGFPVQKNHWETEASLAVNPWCGWGPEVREMQQKPGMPGSGQSGEWESHCYPRLPHVWLGRIQSQMLPACTAKKDKQWTWAVAKRILTLRDRKIKVLLLRMVLHWKSHPERLEALYPGDKPQLDKAFVTWLNCDVISALSNCVGSDVQKSLPT